MMEGRGERGYSLGSCGLLELCKEGSRKILQEVQTCFASFCLYCLQLYDFILAEKGVKMYRTLTLLHPYWKYLISQLKEVPLNQPVIRLACNDFIHGCCYSPYWHVCGCLWGPCRATWFLIKSRSESFEIIIRCLARPCQIFNASRLCQLSIQHGQVPP